MKKIISLLFSLFFLSISISQTVRSGFDLRDWNSTGGQGLSFHANVKSDLHNIETVYLKGCINMFQATRDKKYLNSLIIGAKTDQKFTELYMERNLIDKDSLISQKKNRRTLEFTFGSTYYIADYFSNHKFKTAFEIVGSYSIKRHLDIGLGIHYFNITNYNEIDLSYSGIVLNRKIITDYSFIGMPLRLRWSLSSRLIVPFLSMEIQPSVVLYNRQIESDQIFYSSNSRLERGYFTGFMNLDLGANFNFLKSWILLVESGVHFNFIPMHWDYIGPNGNPIEHKLFMRYFSIQTGIGHKF